MSTWEDVINSERQKEKWRERLQILRPLEQPFSIEQLSQLWGISSQVVRYKLTDWEKRHPWFLFRNTYQQNHLITFTWNTGIVPEPDPDVVVESSSPTISVEVELPKVVETPFILEEQPYPDFLRERTYTETVEKLKGMKKVLTPISTITFEPLAWNKQKQRGRLKVIVTTGKNKLEMTGLYDNGFPISALIKVV